MKNYSFSLFFWGGGENFYFILTPEKIKINMFHSLFWGGEEIIKNFILTPIL